MMDSLVAPKMPSLMNTLVMCDRRRDMQSITGEVGISFAAIQ